jgi:tetratricopeptide (TPR) repeat protein
VKEPTGAGLSGPGESGQQDVAELLPLALSRPQEALTRAQAILQAKPGPYEASVAHQMTGIVLREFGDVHAGVGELRVALTLARRAGSVAREADASAALGVGLVYTGQTARGLAALDWAVSVSAGAQIARMLHRRAAVLWTLGRHDQARRDESRAVGLLRGADDPLWMARALNCRGLANVALGAPARADADFVAAGRLFAKINQQVESIYTIQNRGLAAFASGDLPAALAFFDEAESRYRPLDLPTTALCIDRCAALLAAGLAAEALAGARTGLADIERINGRSTKKAELLLMAASCALATAQPRIALDWADAAQCLFRAQRSTWWQAHAALMLVRARYAFTPASAALLRQAVRAAGQLETLGASQATQARLLAGRVALDLGRRAEADRHLGAAANDRHRGPAMSRAGGWLSAALQAEAAGRSAAMLVACHRGLDVLDEHRVSLGASELRAQATAHGAELAAMALRHAARTGRARALLTWTERWRATTLTIPAVRPPDDQDLHAGLAALRHVSGQLSRTDSGQQSYAALQREQRRLEQAVRAVVLRTRGSARFGPRVFRVGTLLDRLGPARLIEIVDVDGTLHVLVCGAGRVRHLRAGRTQDAIQAAGFARFALRRIARGQTGDGRDAALAVLASAGPRMQEALLGPASRWLGDGPVIIVPPGQLNAIPWGLLPALGGRAFSVAPSATAWLRARAVQPPSRRHVVLARGPGLETDGAEVPQVAPLYGDVTVLEETAATPEQVLDELDGAWLAHVAAHGTFRADSPQFSSLRLHGGSLSVYDLEQLKRAPYRIILSSCDSGVLAPVGADEILGLGSSLLGLGTAGLVAGVAPLNDQAVVPLMAQLHAGVRAGHDLAESLRRVRHCADGDPVMQATALSLLAVGAS